MTSRMLIDVRHQEETRVAVIKNGKVDEFDFEAASRKQIKGNIYLAKITRVEPSLQAAFVEYGGNRHGFLAFSEIHPDYYQIPQEDREALLKEEQALVEEHDALAELDEGEGEEADNSPDGEVGDEAEESDGEESADEADDSDESHRDRRHGDESASNALRRRRLALRRRYKIQEVIRRRQVMLVQVVKEERGNKGAALTTYLSLAGRYSVLMPNTAHGGGISRKIANAADRKRLKTIMAEIELPRSMGAIIRTAGVARTKAEIRRDFTYLTKLWDSIRANTLSSSAPALIYEDNALIKRAIRDIYTRDIAEILVDGEEGYKQARAFMKLLMPSHVRKVKLYADQVPLLQRAGIETQLAALIDPVVRLKSGGYLVINPTEALVSVDVNSGRANREHSIEDTALKTNVEAAEEVARQLRLRDMAGLVVIDFIDMEQHANNRRVERALKEALKVDHARIQVGHISSFGLLEMSRQRLRTGVLEATTVPCPTCAGAGIIPTASAVALAALRLLEDEIVKGRASRFVLHTTAAGAIYILNRKRQELTALEMRYGVRIEIEADHALEGGQMRVEADGPRPDGAENFARMVGLPPLDEAPVTAEEEAEEEEAEEEEGSPEEEETGSRESRSRRGGRRRRRKDTGGSDTGSDNGGRASSRDSTDAPESAGETAKAASAANAASADGSREKEAGEKAASTDEAGGEVKKRSRRGGRRRSRGPREEGAAEATEEAAGAPAEGATPASEVAKTEEKEEKKAPRRHRRARSSKDGSVAKPAEAPASAAEASAVEASAVEIRTAASATPLEAAPAAAAPAPKPTLPAPEPESPPAPVATEAPAPASPAHETSQEKAETETPDGPPRRGWWQRTFGN